MLTKHLKKLRLIRRIRMRLAIPLGFGILLIKQENHSAIMRPCLSIVPIPIRIPMWEMMYISVLWKNQMVPRFSLKPSLQMSLGARSSNYLTKYWLRKLLWGICLPIARLMMGNLGMFIWGPTLVLRQVFLYEMYTMWWTLQNKGNYWLRELKSRFHLCGGTSRLSTKW